MGSSRDPSRSDLPLPIAIGSSSPALLLGLHCFAVLPSRKRAIGLGGAAPVWPPLHVPHSATDQAYAPTRSHRRPDVMCGSISDVLCEQLSFVCSPPRRDAAAQHWNCTLAASRVSSIATVK